MITIGIDPHKSSLTAVALTAGGEVAGTVRLEVTAQSVARLLAWARGWPERRWAVEGATGLGRGIAQGLAAAGESVVDVPAHELCEATEHIEVHHIRQLADLATAGPTPPAWAKAMANKRRKTLVVCRDCHDLIHTRRTPALTS